MFGRMDSVPPRALIKRHDLLAATEVPELHPAVITHRLLSVLHHFPAQASTTTRLVDKNPARSGHRDIDAADPDEADLKTHMGDESRAITDQGVHVCR